MLVLCTPVVASVMWSAATAGPPDFSNVSYADFQHQYGREPYALLGGLNREALFEENKKKVVDLKTQIDQTDREIDHMVYALYGLTEEEIAIVEGS